MILAKNGGKFEDSSISQNRGEQRNDDDDDDDLLQQLCGKSTRVGLSKYYYPTHQPRPFFHSWHFAKA